MRRRGHSRRSRSPAASDLRFRGATGLAQVEPRIGDRKLGTRTQMLPPRKHGLLIPGPQAHWMKLAFEKYFLWKAQHGYVQLP